MSRRIRRIGGLWGVEGANGGLCAGGVLRNGGRVGKVQLMCKWSLRGVHGEVLDVGGLEAVDDRAMQFE